MGDKISLKASDGHQLDAYKAEPFGTSKGGLVVIQEIFGVNSQIRSTVDHFAGLDMRPLLPHYSIVLAKISSSGTTKMTSQ